MDKNIKKRLEYLRKQIRNENISYGEIAELQGLAQYIDKEDVELLQWAGVEENNSEEFICRVCGERYVNLFKDKDYKDVCKYCVEFGCDVEHLRR
jgi:hypothetical protein